MYFLDEQLSSRYASALFSMVENDLEQTKRTLADLRLVNQTINGDPGDNDSNGNEELRNALNSPSITVARKKAVVEKLFSPHVQPLMIHFLKLLLDNGRCRYISDIYYIFRRMFNKKHDVLMGQLNVAAPLDEDLQTMLETELMRYTGKRIDLDVYVRKELIAGVEIQVEESFWDGSFKHQLDIIGKRLRKG